MDIEGIYISYIKLNKKGESKTGKVIKEIFTLPGEWLKIDEDM